jgi:hypothetical protein
MKTCSINVKSNMKKIPSMLFLAKGGSKEPGVEMRRLRKELADTKEECDILKKALAIFLNGLK